MIINYLIVFLIGVAAGTLFFSLVCAASNADDISEAYHKGFEAGRRIANESQSKV